MEEELEKHDLNRKDVFSYVIDGSPRIFVIVLHSNKATLNVIDEDFVYSLAHVLSEAYTRSRECDLVVLCSGKTNSFLAGADIESQLKITDKEIAYSGSSQLQRLLCALEVLPVPTVVVLNGVALGGGLELALACDYRVADKISCQQIGLPEVKLGVIPGAGGCCRLPRLIGLQTSLGLLLTGKAVNSSKAYQLGLVDYFIKTSQCKLAVEDSAIDFGWYEEVKELWNNGKFTLKGQGLNISGDQIKDLVQGTSDVLYKQSDIKAKQKYPKHFRGNTWLEQQIIYYMALQNIEHQTRGNFPAPYICLQAVIQAWRAPTFQEALYAEAQGYSQAAITSQAKAMMGLFISGTRVKREALEYQAISSEAEITKTSTLKKVVVIGNGKDIAAITQNLLYTKFGVSLCVPEERFRSILEEITELYQPLLSKKLLNQLEFDRQMSMLEVDTEAIGGNLKTVLTSMDNPDILVLCLDEHSDEEIIKIWWENIYKYYYPDHSDDELIEESDEESINIPVCAVISSPRTTHFIKSISKNPERIVGVEVFNPRHRDSMCVEISSDKKTVHSAAVKKVAQMFSKQGKTPVVTHCLGEHSVGVHLAVCGWASAVLVAINGGLSINDIDSALREFGYDQGMFEQMDEIGLDKVIDLCSKAHLDNGTVSQDNVVSCRLLCKVVSELIENGSHGKSSSSSAVSEGFYQWNQGKRGDINPRLSNMFSMQSKEHRPPQREELKSTTMAAQVDAIVLVLVCEALFLVNQGMIGASHVDILSVLGLAKFPPFYGGLIKYAETRGFDEILQSMQKLKNIGLIENVPSSLHTVQADAKSQESQFYPGWPRCESLSKKMSLPSMLSMSRQQMFSYLSLVVIPQAILLGFIHSKL